MNKIYILAVCFMIIAVIESCSKKTHPNPSITNPDLKTDTLALTKKADSLITKPATKRKPREPVPRVIIVNDKFASKSVDGRYYYDLQGHRYWRNNKDGKYYLFNKSMLTDDAFKKPD